MAPGPKLQQGIQSIEVGGRLLQALVRAGSPQMLGELASAAGMPAAKAHRYLVSLGRMGLVEHRAETGLYDLGTFALELGLSALARLDPVAEASTLLVALSRQSGQTVALAIWANQGPTMVRWVGPEAPVAASLRLGSVMPLTRSATGRAFLSFSPREKTSTWIERELVENAREGVAPASKKDVDAIVKRVRCQGFSRTSEFIPGIGGMATPVFDHTGDMVLALVALGYSKPFNDAFASISAAVLEAATRLSERLGMRKPA